MSQLTPQATTQAAVATYLDGLNSLDADLALSRFSADAIVHYPGKPEMSKDAFRDSFAEVFTALKSMEFTTREVFETDHGVAARWTFTAETREGRTATCDGIDSWRVSDEGTVSAIDVYYDPSPLAQALAD
jgi:ketosteroid isomerase-like protein